MVLFDSLIREVIQLFEAQTIRELSLTDHLISDAGKNNMVFADEKAFELGGDKNKSLSFDLPTSNSKLIDKDQIILIGKDLNEMREDNDFIRVALLEVEDEEIMGNDLYKRLENIKFTKYRVSPKGYMLRTSTHNKEKVRVSKECAKESFSKIGSAYIKAYKMIPSVKKVKLFFITGNSSLYGPLTEIVNRKDNIVDTIDHILKGMVLNDCNACSAKEICDEVEGLRQLHQNQTRDEKES